MMSEVADRGGGEMANLRTQAAALRRRAGAELTIAMREAARGQALTAAMKLVNRDKHVHEAEALVPQGRRRTRAVQRVGGYDVNDPRQFAAFLRFAGEECVAMARRYLDANMPASAYGILWWWHQFHDLADRLDPPNRQGSGSS